MLLNLIDLMEGFTLNDRGYWHLHNDKNDKVEIFWSKRSSGSKWKVRSINTEKDEITNENLPTILQEFGINSQLFEKELKKKVLSLTTYANMYIQKVQKQLGKEVVDKALQEHEDFSKRLIEAIRSALDDNVGVVRKDNKKPKLRLV